MNRLVSGEFQASIGAALTVIPPAIADRLRHVQFLTGTDPVYAGLHRFEGASFGRSYRTTAHCLYRHLSSDRRTTIVLPTPYEPSVVVHELGHALDEVLAWTHDAKPVNWYATTDRQEAFAEAFRAWLYWYGDQDVFMADLDTRALFARLAA